jgi:ParB family chromosome partitioning protein
MAKPALGRGLGALLGAIPSGDITKESGRQEGLTTREATTTSRQPPHTVPLHRIHPSSLQPRKEFTPDTLQELADSIREQGILQPLLVRPKGLEFELIAGERRWRAAQLAGLTEAPVVVRDADDPTVLELMLIENLQRENLNPIEEAQGYAQLIDQFHLHQEEAAQKVGKSRAVVANALRLLKLPPEVQSWIRTGRLSVGHAKVILGLELPEKQKLAAEKVLRDGLNVRQTEDLVARMQSSQVSTAATGATGKRAAPPREVHVADLENRLQQRLGTRVLLRYRQGKGAIEIRFFNENDLQRILEILGLKED